MLSDSPWREHCRKAVRKFVMNAVVVDDMPVVDSDVPGVSPNPRPPKVLSAHKSEYLPGFGDDDDYESHWRQGVSQGDLEADEEEPNQPSKQEAESPSNVGSNNALNIRDMSDAFADEGVACAFVLPRQDENEQLVLKRVLASALPADILIMDWMLKGRQQGNSEEILQEIAKSDVEEKGRIRLICIYTAEPQIPQIARDAIEALEAGGLVFTEKSPEEGKARGEHFLLRIIKKDENVKELPRILIDEMTELADGILPAFSMAAVAAVRNNTHHIISRFSRDLDGAYVANRMITSPPGEVAELMRELFASECDTALGLESVADKFLENDVIKLWLEDRSQPINKDCDFSKNKKINREVLDNLLDHELVKGQALVDGTRQNFSEGKRKKLSVALHSSEGEAKEAEYDFAKYVVLKRGAFGSTKIKPEHGEWAPSLTLGTLLQKEKQDGETILKEYFYCLTPACDTIRMAGEIRTFLLLELFENTEKPNLIIANGGDDLCLSIDPKPINIQAFKFKGCEKTGRARATQDNHLFVFNDEEDPSNRFVWLGEVRRNRANRDMADLNREWLRLGIKDSEYLRLSGK